MKTVSEHDQKKIHDAAKDSGAVITEMESKPGFSKVKFERDYIPFELVIDHRDSYTSISMNIAAQFETVKGIYLSKKN